MRPTILSRCSRTALISSCVPVGPPLKKLLSFLRGSQNSAKGSYTCADTIKCLSSAALGSVGGSDALSVDELHLCEPLVTVRAQADSALLVFASNAVKPSLVDQECKPDGFWVVLSNERAMITWYKCAKDTLRLVEDFKNQHVGVHITVAFSDATPQ
jgi:hypothetical protein